MKHSRTITLAIAAILAVAACAAPAAPSAAPPQSAAPASAAAPASEAPASAAAPAGPNAELTAALAGEYTGTTVDVFAQWIDAEGQAFDDSLKSFRDATGINVVYSGITNYETVLNVRVDGGVAPDVAQLAQAGLMTAVPGGRQAHRARQRILDPERSRPTTARASWTPVRSTASSTACTTSRTSSRSSGIPWQPFESAGLRRSDDVGRARRAERPDRCRRQQPLVHHDRARRRLRLGRNRLDRGRPPPDGPRRHLRQVGHPRDPVQRPCGRQRGQHRRARCGSPRATPTAATPGSTRRGSATRRPRCSTRPAPSAGCTSRLPGSPTSGRRTGTAPRCSSRASTARSSTSPPSTQQYGNPVLGGSDMFVSVQRPPRGPGVPPVAGHGRRRSGARRHRRLPGRQQRRSRGMVHELPDVRVWPRSRATRRCREATPRTR